MIRDAVIQYKTEVETGVFPGPEHVFKMSKEEADKL